MSFHDNSILIEELKKGEKKAYMFLLDKYHRRLHAYAITLIGDYSMAQDIVQNVYVKTWKFRKKLNSSYSIQSFLYKSVYNEFIDVYQRNQNLMLVQQKYVESLVNILENTNEGDMDKMIAVVTREIQNLPPKCQKIFVLSKKEGLTNIEISDHLNISVKTVEAQITKGFSVLRRKLGDQF